jgi:hypothetical protein
MSGVFALWCGERGTLVSWKWRRKVSWLAGKIEAKNDRFEKNKCIYGLSK